MNVNNYRWRDYKFRILNFLIVLFVVTTIPVSCRAGQQSTEEEIMALSITSPAFQEGDKIPDKYTSQGQDISPPLAWTESPEGTLSFALIMDDPDAPGGTFTHWVIFNMPPESRGLPEAVPAEGQLSDNTLQGMNDFSRIGYSGPCPPAGRTHRYQFTLYALDRILDLNEGVSKKQVLDTISGHAIAQGRLTGTYQR